jgi:hypothetical protein
MSMIHSSSQKAWQFVSKEAPLSPLQDVHQLSQDEVLRNRGISGRDVAHVLMHSTIFGYQPIPEVNDHREQPLYIH